jgi:hypothetical protein
MHRDKLQCYALIFLLAEKTDLIGSLSKCICMEAVCLTQAQRCRANALKMQCACNWESATSLCANIWYNISQITFLAHRKASLSLIFTRGEIVTPDSLFCWRNHTSRNHCQWQLLWWMKCISWGERRERHVHEREELKRQEGNISPAARRKVSLGQDGTCACVFVCR